MLASGSVVACGTSSNGSSFPGGDDAGSDAQAACGGCNCTEPDTGAPVSVTAEQACDLLASDPPQSVPADVTGAACRALCPTAPFCEVPADFASAFAALNADGGVAADAGSSDGGSSFQCPAQAAPVTITCGVYGCLGRLTAGFAAPKNQTTTWGDRLAAMAFLEAVSVHAFERLERELRAHGASADLLQDARRARRDEQRHTVMMTALARRNGCRDVRLPDAPLAAPVRSLFEMALENAVEGCVRETYGAVVGLIEGETSTSRAVRSALRSVAVDECRHAELAWAVHAWVMPQLSATEAADVRSAMQTAIAEIAARDPRTAEQLFDGSTVRLAA